MLLGSLHRFARCAAMSLLLLLLLETMHLVMAVLLLLHGDRHCQVAAAGVGCRGADVVLLDTHSTGLRIAAPRPRCRQLGWMPWCCSAEWQFQDAEKKLETSHQMCRWRTAGGAPVHASSANQSGGEQLPSRPMDGGASDPTCCAASNATREPPKRCARLQALTWLLDAIEACNVQCKYTRLCNMNAAGGGPGASNEPHGRYTIFPLCTQLATGISRPLPASRHHAAMD